MVMLGVKNVKNQMGVGEYHGEYHLMYNRVATLLYPSQMACQLTANMSAKQIDMTGCISFSVSLGSPEQILAVSSDHVPCDLLAIFAPNPLINHGKNRQFLRKCQDF